MCLPTPIDNLLVFELMEKSAIKVANMLQGDVYNSEHRPIDDTIIVAMRAKVIDSI